MTQTCINDMKNEVKGYCVLLVSEMGGLYLTTSNIFHRIFFFFFFFHIRRISIFLAATLAASYFKKVDKGRL